MSLLSTRPLRGLLAGLLSALLVACGGGSDAPAPAAPLATLSSEIPVVYLQGDFYGNWPVQSYVARTEAEWRQIWDQHDPQQIPAPEMPVVDFALHTVVGVSLGWGADGCHGFQIVRIMEEAEQIRVEYRHTFPDWGTGSPQFFCTMALVPLVGFAKIPATAKPIVFTQLQG